MNKTVEVEQLKEQEDVKTALSSGDVDLLEQLSSFV